MHNNLTLILSNVNREWASKLSSNIKEVLGMCYTRTYVDNYFISKLFIQGYN